MIALEHVSARDPRVLFKTPSHIRDVSFTWERGVLAILGAPLDGTTVLLQTLAGILPVRAGKAVVDGRTPEASRSRVAWVASTTSLPDALRVEEVCLLEAELRGREAVAPAARLGVLGLESLAKRRVRSLAPGEARSVALALALTSKAPVVLVDEPLAGLETMAPGRVIEALRACGRTSAVVVTTSSVRDATRVADQLGILVRGTFKHLSASLAHADGSGARLRVVIAAEGEEEVAPFIEALGRDASVSSVETAAYRGTRVLHAAMAVVLSGSDLLALARAVAAAATASHANVLTIESAVLPLDAIRGAVMGVSPTVMTAPAAVSAPMPSAELLPSEEIEVADAISEPSAPAALPVTTPSADAANAPAAVAIAASAKPAVDAVVVDAVSRPAVGASAKPAVHAASVAPPKPSGPSLPPPLPPRARTVGLAPARPTDAPARPIVAPPATPARLAGTSAAPPPARRVGASPGASAASPPSPPTPARPPLAPPARPPIAPPAPARSAGAPPSASTDAPPLAPRPTAPPPLPPRAVKKEPEDKS